MLFSPNLFLEHAGPKAREKVFKRYPAATQPLDFGAASTASVTVFSSPEVVDCMYIRVFAYNVGRYAANNVRAYINRVSLNGKAIDKLRSPLHWMDTKEQYSAQWPMRKGKQYGAYVDVCATDPHDGVLELITEDRLQGRHRYKESGTYTLEITAEADRPCWDCKLILRVGFEGDHWNKLQVVSSEVRKGIFARQLF